MCLSLSRLQHAKPDELAELREQGKRHLEFACSPERLQIERGGRVQLTVWGNVGPACKVTLFMTNDVFIAEAVDRHCFGGHDHIQLLSGRAKSCEKYLPRLVAATLRALRQSMRAAGGGEAQRMMSQQWRLGRLEEPELLSLPDNADGDQEFRAGCVRG